jgi:hypothetical protein
MAKRIIQFDQARKKHLLRRFYPLQLPFSYIALRRGRVVQKGWGETAEISSNHVRVKPLGLIYEDVTEMIMSITWPAKLPDGAGLQLMFHALPVRDGSSSELFRILRHEFRTASRDANGAGLRAGLLNWNSGDSDERTDAPPTFAVATAAGMAVSL